MTEIYQAFYFMTERIYGRLRGRYEDTQITFTVCYASEA